MISYRIKIILLDKNLFKSIVQDQVDLVKRKKGSGIDSDNKT